jgi:hypothetical protein
VGRDIGETPIRGTNLKQGGSTMSKFKVGDKVKIVSKTHGHDFAIGATGIITAMALDNDYIVSGRHKYDGTGTQIIHESSLELVTSKPALPKNAVKWIEALRSGKFKQTRGLLKHEDAFCGLGVACEIYRKTRKKGSIKWVNGAIFGSTGILPIQVMKWLGIKNQYGTSYSNGLVNGSVISLNDNGASFSKIADFIERNADNLFVSEASRQASKVNKKG